MPLTSNVPGGILLGVAACAFAGCISGEPPPAPVNDDHAFAVAVQSDGRIVAAGNSTRSATAESVFALARYNPDGSPDAAFGAGGKVTTQMFFHDRISAVAVQDDGKIVAAGHASIDLDSFALARYNPDGSLDAAFGGGGKVTTAVGAPEGSAGATAVAIQDDGRIVAAGFAENGSRFIALVRYHGDGTLDNTFGDGGKVFAGAVDAATTVAYLALQGDGRILAVWNTEAGAGRPKFTMARYLGDGSPDPSFGSGGKVTTSSAYHDTLTAVAVQADGKIVAAGCSYIANVGYGWYELVLRRFNGDGAPDPTFGTGGTVLTNVRDSLYPLVASLRCRTTDGTIVVVGTSSMTFVLARYNSDGTPDDSFGSGGKADTNTSPGLGVSDIALQADGAVILGGGAYRDKTGYDFAVKRYRADGSPDNTFGSGGMATTAF